VAACHLQQQQICYEEMERGLTVFLQRILQNLDVSLVIEKGSYNVVGHATD
jgi:hypothetical protein